MVSLSLKCCMLLCKRGHGSGPAICLIRSWPPPRWQVGTSTSYIHPASLGCKAFRFRECKSRGDKKSRSRQLGQTFRAGHPGISEPQRWGMRCGWSRPKATCQEPGGTWQAQPGCGGALGPICSCRSGPIHHERRFKHDFRVQASICVSLRSEVPETSHKSAALWATFEPIQAHPERGES